MTASPPDLSIPYPPALYEALHGVREEDLRFYRAAARGAGAVLELGCGHGRIAAALAEESIPVVGIDQSEDALRVARKRVPTGTFLKGDMRDFSLEERFDRILCPYNGMYCLLTEGEQLQTLRRVRDHLVPGGLFVFDGYAADVFHGEGDASGGAESSFVGEIHADGTEWTVYETSNWHREDQFIEVVYAHHPADGRAPVHAAIPQRYLLRAQVEPMLEAAGLIPIVVHGDFDQSVWDEEAPYLIVTAMRPLDDT